MPRQMIEMLPEFMQGVKEFKEIMQAEQVELEVFTNYIDQALDENFLDDMTEYGIERWESLLGITPKATSSLEERRMSVKMKLKKDLPYTMRSLEQKLAEICGQDGYTLDYDNNKYTLTIKISLIVKANFEDVENLLERIVPANLIIDLSLRYNSHLMLSSYTHGQLAKYTHTQLREGVIA